MMCYAKPGPRCSAHARKSLTKAQTVYDLDPSPDNYDKLADARDSFDGTPEGQRDLQEIIDAYSTGRLALDAAIYRKQRGAQVREEAMEAYYTEYPDRRYKSGVYELSSEEFAHHTNGELDMHDDSVDDDEVYGSYAENSDDDYDAPSQHYADVSNSPDFSSTQHCTNEDCYTFSHTAQYCNKKQPRFCECAFDYENGVAEKFNESNSRAKKRAQEASRANNRRYR